jgi:hypothetical protein
MSTATRMPSATQSPGPIRPGQNIFVDIANAGDWLVNAGEDTRNFVWKHKGKIAGGVAAGGCIVATIGTCGVLVAGAGVVNMIDPTIDYATGETTGCEHYRVVIVNGSVTIVSLIPVERLARVAHLNRWATPFQQRLANLLLGLPGAAQTMLPSRYSGGC